ncbi:DUF4435 domain-containing protein [Burkholderia multivorans]|uniref:DUF4435 domain-containing protein n=1 Tax=Burkholderia multivorans TaxID=87883 RepID=UPI001C23456A|nr:DUF4435 domain-containing protein [Burkholderia multivorans]MBU9262857.1 DUF4435 domain-containing protein [Burkholderia multivorans]
MNNNDVNGVRDDGYLRALSAAKEVVAVAKVEFAAFASAVPDDVKIFAYEGVADKIIYYHWLAKVGLDIAYEPYVCRNKRNALNLFDVLSADMTGLGDRVYYFVDHDFDGLQGRAAHFRIFCSDRYSVENFVVSSSVLEDLLTIDFHCHGHPIIRARVREVFDDVYRQFLDATKKINFRIFLARRLGIRQLDDLPERINQLARVELRGAWELGVSESDLVKLEREPTEEEAAALIKEFEVIRPEYGYRGKFALAFFIKWLGLLRDDRISGESTLFSAVPPAEFSVNGGFSLATLAPKAAVPDGLPAFLGAI